MSEVVNNLQRAINECRTVYARMVDLYGHGPADEVHGWGNAMQDAVEHIATLEQRWIPVSERLPEDVVEVLTYVVDKNNPGKPYRQIDYRDEEEWWNINEYYEAATTIAFPEGTTFSRPVVTHWMPLPAPPSTEGEGQ